MHRKLSIGGKKSKKRDCKFFFSFPDFPSFSFFVDCDAKHRTENRKLSSSSKTEIKLNNRKRVGPAKFFLLMSALFQSQSLILSNGKGEKCVSIFFLFIRRESPHQELHLHWQVLSYGGCTLAQMGDTKIVEYIDGLTWQILEKNPRVNKSEINIWDD